MAQLSKFGSRLAVKINAGFQLMSLQSQEIARVRKEFADFGAATGVPVLAWDTFEKLTVLFPTAAHVRDDGKWESLAEWVQEFVGSDESPADFPTLVHAVTDTALVQAEQRGSHYRGRLPARCLFLLFDAHRDVDETMVTRLTQLHSHNAFTCPLPDGDGYLAHPLVFCQAAASVHPELDHAVEPLELPLLSAEEIAEHCVDFIAHSIEQSHSGAESGLAGPEGATLRYQLAEACRGLLDFQVNDVLAEATLATGSQFSPACIETVRTYRAARLKATRIVSVYEGKETFADVAGLSALKQYLAGMLRPREGPRLAQPKGVFLFGTPGCLAGDTPVWYNRGQRPGGRPLPLVDFYRKFHGITTSTPAWRNLGSPVYLQSLTESGVIRYNRVAGVVESGVKELVRVEFDDGTVLRLTPGHLIATPGAGFVPAGDLAVGAQVTARGDMMARSRLNGRPKQRRRRAILHVKHHPLGNLHIVNGYRYQRIFRSRLVVESAMNELTYTEFVHCLNNDPARAASLQYLPRGLEVHHKDEDPMNDAIDNLQVMTSAEHARHHGKFENFNVSYTREVRVRSVQRDAREMTYDVQMAAPDHNFCANGIVVHNCGKSLLARATGNASGRLVLRSDMGSLVTSEYGGTERNMSRMVQIAEATGRCVLMLDEAEKMFAGLESSGKTDGGTTARAVGDFLKWSAERGPESGVFLFATCNDIHKLPAAFYRAGRFNAVFYAGMPSREAKKAMWDLYIGRFGLDPRQPLPDDSDWTGAEIANCCEQAYILECPLKEATQFLTRTRKLNAQEMRELEQLAEEIGALDAELGGPYRRGRTAAGGAPGTGGVRSRKLGGVDPNNN